MEFSVKAELSAEHLLLGIKEERAITVFKPATRIRISPRGLTVSGAEDETGGRSRSGSADSRSESSAAIRGTKSEQIDGRPKAKWAFHLDLTSIQTKRRRRAKSVNLDNSSDALSFSEPELMAASEELPETAIAAGRGLRSYLTGKDEHHGPISPPRSKKNLHLEGEMMSTVDLLKLIKRCRKPKAQTPIRPGEKGHQFNSLELRKYLEEQRDSLRQLSRYGELVMAVETEDKVADALFLMFHVHLEARAGWPKSVEFSEMRLEMMGLVYQMLGLTGGATTVLANRKFIGSGLHKALLALIPLMKADEIELVDEYLEAIFTPEGPAQEYMVEWLQQVLNSDLRAEFESGKPWATFVLGKLIMTIRHPKRHAFESPIIMQALFGRVLKTEIGKRLDVLWNSLFFQAILPLYQSEQLDSFLHPFRLAYGALGHYNAQQATSELAWHRIMAMSESMISSSHAVKTDSLVAQLDFLLGAFNYGALPKVHWKRFFHILFSMLTRQPGADWMLAEVLQEPGILMEAEASIDEPYVLTILNGLAKWAASRIEEKEDRKGRSWLDFVNEQPIIKTMALWTPILEALRPEDEQVEAIKARWAKIKSSTSLHTTLILPVNHAYEGLPTLRAVPAPKRVIERSRSEGYRNPALVASHSLERPKILHMRSTNDLKMPRTRPRFHRDSASKEQSTGAEVRPQLSNNDSQQQLIRNARSAMPSSSWSHFASTQTLHVVAGIESIPKIPEEPTKREIRKAQSSPRKRKAKAQSTTEAIRRATTDLDLTKKKHQAERQAAGKSKTKRSKRPDSNGFSLASEEALDLALQQLAALEHSSPGASPKLSVVKPDKPAKQSKHESSKRHSTGPASRAAKRRVGSVKYSSSEIASQLVPPLEASIFNVINELSESTDHEVEETEPKKYTKSTSRTGSGKSSKNHSAGDTVPKASSGRTLPKTSSGGKKHRKQSPPNPSTGDPEGSHSVPVTPRARNVTHKSSSKKSDSAEVVSPAPGTPRSPISSHGSRSHSGKQRSGIRTRSNSHERKQKRSESDKK